MPTENVKVQFHSSHGNGRVPQAISKLTYRQRSPLYGAGGSRCGSSVDGHARPAERPTRLYGRRLTPPPRRRCPRRSSRTQARPDCARHGRRLSRAWIRIRRGLLYMISRTSGPPSAMPGSSGGCSRSRSAEPCRQLDRGVHAAVGAAARRCGGAFAGPWPGNAPELLVGRGIPVGDIASKAVFRLTAQLRTAGSVVVPRLRSARRAAAWAA